jgi:hypothetical protein
MGGSVVMREVYLAPPLICHNVSVNTADDKEIIATIRSWASELGFQDIGFTGVDLGEHEGYLKKWLDAGYEGDDVLDGATRDQAQPPSRIGPGYLHGNLMPHGLFTRGR